jgi:hypothetical protein
MKYEFSRAKVILVTILVFAIAAPMGLILSGGCTNTLDGELNPNQKPIVYFVNIPPGPREVCDTVDNVITCDTIITQFSRNPVIHWVGTDRDGIISSYRYCVATVPELGGLDPMTFVGGISESEWIELEVDPKGPNPMTTNTISMSADLSDPVRTFVPQYVFLQAFDDQDMGSDIVYRLFSRNDNPPDTDIWPVLRPSINAETPGGIVTGVGIKYSAEDPIDYPSDPPPFEFQWRLYGPYSDSTLALIEAEYFTEVCPTADGQVYRLGEEIWQCDTIFTEEGTVIESCLVCTCEVDLTPPPEMAAYVSLEDYFDIDSLPDSLIRFGDISYNGSLINYVLGCGAVDSVRQYKCEAASDPDTWLTGSGVDAWIPQISSVSEQTLYNVFWNFNSDTTLQMNYVFWVRSRDDAMVPDLVPAFKIAAVINPRYERDVLVLDLNQTVPKMWVPVDDETFSTKMYWKETIDAWAETSGRDSIVFDTVEVSGGAWEGRRSSPDYIRVFRWDGTVPIAELLKHKVVILYNDCLNLVQTEVFPNVYTAIDAGVNVWATWRTFLEKQRKSPPDLAIYPPFQFTWYFGVERTAWSGWVCFTCESSGDPCLPCGYYQDFIGAGSKYPEVWPYLPLDTALLHSRYIWKSDTWEGDVGEGVVARPGLPEVAWSQLMNGTTAIYKYKSSFGQSHPLGFNFAFQGRPVGHVYHTSLFKTAHFTFTPIAIQPDSMQKTANVLLDWLYERDAQLPTELGGSAPVQISTDDARANAVRRQESQLLEMGLDQPTR